MKLKVGDRVRVKLSDRCPENHETLLDGEPGLVDGAEGTVRQICTSGTHRFYVSDADPDETSYHRVDGLFRRFELEVLAEV
jgi:hypothetical protein